MNYTNNTYTNNTKVLGAHQSSAEMILMLMG